MSLDLGPLNVLIAWQALVVAVLVAISTTGVKTVINLIMKGEGNRKKNKWVTQLLLPVIPVFLGGMAGGLLPIRPEVVAEYVAKLGSAAWIVHTAWGMVVGVFADYLYQRVKKVMEVFAPPIDSSGGKD